MLLISYFYLNNLASVARWARDTYYDYAVILLYSEVFILASQLYQRGQGLVEYALILVLIVIVVVVTLAFPGPQVGELYSLIVF